MEPALYRFLELHTPHQLALAKTRQRAIHRVVVLVLQVDAKDQQLLQIGLISIPR